MLLSRLLLGAQMDSFEDALTKLSAELSGSQASLALADCRRRRPGIKGGVRPNGLWSGRHAALLLRRHLC
jgi:hypothetical protein